jgi:16S rRNA (cytosine1402-N4)-methyltransferase
MSEISHIPVLLNETIEGLNIKPNGIYVDLTLGRAGHSSEILKRLNKEGLLIGVDQDKEAIEESDKRLSKIASNYKLVKSNFVNFEDILTSLNIDKVDGVLMDLGVSSPQFDESSRGFSYRYDAPLDMRMDVEQKLTAKEVINTYPEAELRKIFYEYGEDKYSASIAHNIVKSRAVKPISTTFELVDIIKRSKPAKELKKVGHPAKQIFQALRIEVNNELNVLKETLGQVVHHLNSHGRLAVITFHSLEDKIVKKLFKELTVVEGNRTNFPLVREEKDYILITRKGIRPSENELENNHRSASSTLRIIEKK